jgi:tight adherence protein C
MGLVLVCAMLGYYLPNAILAHLVARYQQALFNAFPDALDLMRVCVQAGLGLDAAIDRVGHEMRLSCAELSSEFELTGLELRAGASRADALRHLSARIGLEDVEALVVMLIQADMLGTSVHESLQVHSESLRTKRRLLAEETAAKLPVKLLIPLVFCVFPALLTVLLGPAVISVQEVLAPTAQGA